eukprot:GHVU01170888.1.p2 GENE.GHVU01170888.1~~GHVU01170888.1.p2  ORF type:complete len:114 (-),score=13.35 GHVU01170888.1:321-662(-)
MMMRLTLTGPNMVQLHWERDMSSLCFKPQETPSGTSPFCPLSNSSRSLKLRGTTMFYSVRSGEGEVEIERKRGTQSQTGRNVSTTIPNDSGRIYNCGSIASSPPPSSAQSAAE